MAASEFNSRRLTFQVKNCEVKVRLGVLLIELDCLTHFVLGTFQPTTFPNQDAQIEMGFRILRIKIDGLTESRQAGVKIIFLVIDNPEGQPCLLSGRVKKDRFLQMLLRLRNFAETKLCRTEVCPSHWMSRNEFSQLLEIALGIFEIIISKIGEPPRSGAFGILRQARK